MSIDGSGSLVEEMYTKSDVEDILDGLRKVIRVGGCALSGKLA